MAQIIQGYIEPHLEIHEALAVTNTVERARASAVVVGPNYKLARYGDENVEGAPYVKAGTDIPLAWDESGTFVPVTDETPVDTTYTTVQAEELEASLATMLTTASDASITIDAGDSSILRISPGLFYKKGTTGSLNPVLYGAPINVGDLVYTKATDAAGESMRNTVTDIVGKKSAAAVSQPTAGANNATAPAGFNVPTVGTTGDIKLTSPATQYTGAANTQYVLECITAPMTAATPPVPTGDYIGAEFAIYDTVGIDITSVVKITTANQVVSVGSAGVQVTISKASVKPALSVGDKFVVSCSASVVSTTEFDGIRISGYPLTDLSSYVPGAKIHAELRRPFSGTLPEGDSWSYDSINKTIILFADLNMLIPDRTTNKQAMFADGAGMVYPSFRALIPGDPTKGPIELSSISDIVAAYGTIDMDNDIAYGANAALQAAGGYSVFGVAVPTNDLVGYTAALKKTSQSDGYYMFSILSDKLDIISYATQFALECSKYDVMNYRKVYAGVDSPGEYMACDTDSNGNYLRASVSADIGGQNVVVTFADPNFNLNSFSLDEVIPLTARAGDSVLIAGSKYVIKRIVSNTQLTLVSGPPTVISPAAPVELWKSDSPENTKDYLVGLANSQASRRCTLVWSDRPIGTSGNVVPMKYASSYMVGLRSANIPQKSLTMSQVAILANAPRMHTVWDRKLLNQVAAGGVTIISQDSENDPCVIRHQLTTEVGKGSLYYEDNVTFDIDTILLACKDYLKPLIGDMNVVSDTLITVREGLKNVLDIQSAKPTGANSRLGPALVKYDSLSVTQDPKFYDRIIIKTNLYVPLPLNQIAMYAVVMAADAQEITTTITLNGVQAA